MSEIKDLSPFPKSSELASRKPNILVWLDYPVIKSSETDKYNSDRRAIENDWSVITDEDRKTILDLFGRFFFDPGLARSGRISDDSLAQIKQADPAFNQPQYQAEMVFNRRSLIRIAASAILAGKAVGLVNFDIKNLRLADQAGFGEPLLRLMVQIVNSVLLRDQFNSLGLQLFRVGGDEFVLLWTGEKNQADQQLEGQLSAVYAAVKDEFKTHYGYYLEDKDGQTVVAKKPAEIKETDADNQVLLVSKDDDINRVLSRLVRNQVPAAKHLRTIKVDNTTRSRLERLLISRYRLELKQRDILLRDLEKFQVAHPTYNQQSEVIKQLATRSTALASYLFSVIDQYFDDPLLLDQGRPVKMHSLPDLIDYLFAKKTRISRFISYVFFPWTKNTNADPQLGYDATDQLIQGLYHQLRQELKAKNGEQKPPLMARQGGDFIIFHNQTLSFLPMLDLQNAANQREKHLVFEDRLPVFASFINFPDLSNVNISQLWAIIDNLKAMARQQFFDWLNRQWEENTDRGKKITDYYLTERTADRVRELLNWCQTGSKINDHLIRYLKAKKSTA